MEGKNTKQKLFMNYIQASSLSKLLTIVNNINKDFPDSPILNDDIVQIMKNGEDSLLSTRFL